jgi:hypothetical protein
MKYTDKDREQAAYIIYQRLPYLPTHWHPHKPEWGDNSVSPMKDMCRSIADSIFDLLKSNHKADLKGE